MVQYANYAGLLTSLPTVEEVLDDHASELARSALHAVGADTLLRFLNRLSCKTFFDTPIWNQPDQCSYSKDPLRQPRKTQCRNDC